MWIWVRPIKYDCIIYNFQEEKEKRIKAVIRQYLSECNPVFMWFF